MNKLEEVIWAEVLQGGGSIQKRIQDRDRMIGGQKAFANHRPQITGSTSDKNSFSHEMGDIVLIVR